jgi:hypothetical protein
VNDSTHDVSRLSHTLAHDFLRLRHEGYALPECIVLFGGPKDLLDALAAGMKQEITAREETHVRIIAAEHITSTATNEFQIDIKYFLAHLNDASA